MKEGSKADMKADKGMKKPGMSMKGWEGSKKDKKMDGKRMMGKKK